MTTTEILSILKPCDFDELTYENFEYNVVDNLDIPDLEWDKGMSKGVLFFPGEDFVIKIPFSGQECAKEVYDEESDTWEETGDTYYSSFQFAPDEECGDDYCKVEWLLYQKAKTHPAILPLFAETSFIGYVNDCPIYMQPLCETFLNAPHYHQTHRYSDKDQEETKTSCQNNRIACFNPIWLTAARKTFGEAVFQEFCDFIKEQGIGDLHTENIGFRNEIPILIDYSDYLD